MLARIYRWDNARKVRRTNPWRPSSGSSCSARRRSRTDGSRQWKTLNYSYGGRGACGDYTGIGEIDTRLVDLGLVDPVDHNGGILTANHRPASPRSPTVHRKRSSSPKSPGRPELWRASGPVAESYAAGAAGIGGTLTFGQGSTPDGATKLGPCAINCTNGREVYSFHPSGAVAVFGVRPVHFLKADIDIRIFARLGTRAGGEVVSTGDY